MTDEHNGLEDSCEECSTAAGHRVWCSVGGGPELTAPDNCTVGIDHEQFPAYVDPAGPLWNGAVVPGFRASVADQVVAWLNDCFSRYGDSSDRAEWNRDVIIVHSPIYEGEPGYQPERVAVADDGRFYIGAARYTWQLTGERAGTGTVRPRRPRRVCTHARQRTRRRRGPGRREA